MIFYFRDKDKYTWSPIDHTYSIFLESPGYKDHYDTASQLSIGFSLRRRGVLFREGGGGGGPKDLL